MKFAHIATIVLLGAAIAAPVWAQAGSGMGGGPGRGQGFAFDQNNTPGWTLMTPAERSALRGKMMAAKTYEECKTLQAEQHTAMAARATEKGVTLPAPRQNGCDRMQARGFFK